MKRSSAPSISPKSTVPRFMVMPDEIVAHMRERIVFPEPGEIAIEPRKAPTVPPEQYKPYDTSFGDVPPLAAFGSGYKFHVTGLNKMQDGFPTNKAEIVQAEEERQVRKVDACVDDIVTFEEYLLDDAEVVVVAYGSTSRSARYAVNVAREQGIKAGHVPHQDLLAVPGQADQGPGPKGQGFYRAGDEPGYGFP